MLLFFRLYINNQTIQTDKKTSLRQRFEKIKIHDGSRLFSTV